MKLRAPDGRLTSAAFTGALALFLLLNAFALNGIQWLAASEPYDETVLSHSWDVIQVNGSDDSWGAMKEALDYLHNPGPLPLYSEIFFVRETRFQYPPSSLFALAGMLYLAGPDRVRTNELREFPYPTVNDLMGLAFILMIAAASTALLEIGLRQQNQLADERPILMAARVAIVLGLTLTFYPITKAFTLGQIQVWINGFFAIALFAWVMGAKASSGLLIGLACLIKPHYGVFVLWGALRREWRFTIACGATIALGLAAAITLYGWANHVDYLRVLSFLSQHGETYYPNQSFNGLLNRVMSVFDPVVYKNLDFFDGDFPPFNPWIYGATLVTSSVMLAAALLRTGTVGDPDRKLDFCIMGLSATMASPIAWEHHYGIILPVFAILLAAAIGHPRRLLWLGISYVLISNYIPATQLLAPTLWNVAQSYVFLAALVVLVMLHGNRPGWQMIGASAKTPSPKAATA
jgi:alpha-1,2-mannosyltransferase